MSDYYFKLDDVNDPFKPFMNNIVVPLSASLYKNHIREMSEIRIKSDKSLVFESYEEEKKFKLTGTREIVDLRPDHALFPGTFNQLSIITTGNTQIYIRTYRKLFDIIVQIGGFFNGIIYTATVFLYLYSNNLILWNCIYNVISTNELEERLINQKIKIDLEKEKVENINESESENIRSIQKNSFENMNRSVLENNRSNQQNSIEVKNNNYMNNSKK